MAQKIIDAFGGDVNGKRIGILGTAFKPNTDDVRDSPALVIIPLLQEAGADIAAYDPAAMAQTKQHITAVDWKKDAYGVAAKADALVIITEWNEFRALDMRKIRDSLKEKRLIDLRNIYKPAEMEALGFHYVSIGRPEVKGQKAVLKEVSAG